MNPKYQEVQNLENINAVTDKMVMDTLFLSRFMNADDGIEEILKENGFELTGQFMTAFEEFILSIRKETMNLLCASVNKRTGGKI
ncbi:MAG: hypothetical protein IKH28_10465 [Lachnospiraceae bacterium]|nr:hypothetical protein [Lachnospiraceae bacterium]